MSHGVFLSVMSMGWPDCRFFAGQAEAAIIPLFRQCAKPADETAYSGKFRWRQCPGAIALMLSG
jgi:hypothetical protein